MMSMMQIGLKGIKTQLPNKLILDYLNTYSVRNNFEALSTH